MKKIFFLSLLVLFSTALFAETKCTMLKDDGILWVKGEDGVMSWTDESSNVPAGTVLDLISDEIVTATLKTSTGTDENIKFYGVRNLGKDFYVLASQVGLGSAVCVLTDKAVLYTKPRLQSFRNAYIDECTIGVYGETKNQQGISFIKLQFFDTQAWVVRTRYVLKENLSTSSVDVKAIQLLQKSKTVKDETMSKEFISNALDLETSEEIKEIIQEEYNKIFKISKKPTTARSSSTLESAALSSLTGLINIDELTSALTGVTSDPFN